MALDPQWNEPSPRYGEMRASTADKERSIDVLKSGYAEGRLTKEEHDERAGQVYSSRTYAELAAVTSDLPAGPLGMSTAGPLVPHGRPVVRAGGRTNGLAVASFVCAFIPGIPWLASFGLGIAARAQIKERGDRGIGLANAGLAISGFFISILVIFILTRTL